MSISHPWSRRSPRVAPVIVWGGVPRERGFTRGYHWAILRIPEGLSAASRMGRDVHFASVEQTLTPGCARDRLGWCTAREGFHPGLPLGHPSDSRGVECCEPDGEGCPFR